MKPADKARREALCAKFAAAIEESRLRMTPDDTNVILHAAIDLIHGVATQAKDPHKLIDDIAAALHEVIDDKPTMQ